MTKHSIHSRHAFRLLVVAGAVPHRPTFNGRLALPVCTVCICLWPWKKH